jgi:hypothetical protein
MVLTLRVRRLGPENEVGAVRVGLDDGIRDDVGKPGAATAPAPSPTRISGCLFKVARWFLVSVTQADEKNCGDYQQSRQRAYYGPNNDRSVRSRTSRV